MIKINVLNIDAIVMNHYDKLTKKDGNKKTLLNRLEQKKNKHRKLKREFFEDLINDVKLKDGNSILISKPEYLENRANYYESKFSTILTNNFKKDLLKIFYYNNYDKWGAYILANSLSVNVCPYCNCQYTFTIGNDKNKSIRPQFDHFFSKEKFPYLALSFYNLIPCCSNCNTSLKGRNEFSISKNIHPYEDSFGDHFKFTLSVKNVEFINCNPNSYNINFRIKNNTENSKIQKCENNIEIFKIDELHNCHKDYVNELIIKSRIFTKEYVEQLFSQFGGVYFSNIEDVYRILLSNYILEEDLDKRVLAKLTKDISEELGLIQF